MNNIKTLNIFGLASNKLVKTIKLPTPIDKNITLMDFLLQNNITIASSCNGEGTCHKCIVNNHLISCQMTLEMYLLTFSDTMIRISYL